MEFDRRVDLAHHGGKPWHAAQHRIFANDDAGIAHTVSRDEPACEIAIADILGERVGDIACERRIECVTVLGLDFGKQRRHGGGFLGLCP
jgi:hypothetical protein